MLGASTLASWGPWDDPGALGVTGKNTLGSRLGLLLMFGGFRELVLKVCWVPLTKTGVFFHVCVRVYFSNDSVGLNLDVWGADTCVWYKGIAKIIL